MKKPPLTLVQPHATGVEPPSHLAAPGRALWLAVLNQFRIADVGGVELLQLAAETKDQIESLRTAVERDGPVVYGRSGPRPHPGIRDLNNSRALLSRLLVKLGVIDEGKQPSLGRPPCPTGWMP